MIPRFVLDESSWASASACAGELPPAVDALLMRIEVATDREEVLAMDAAFREAPIGSGLALYSLMYEPECPVQLERDLRERLCLAVDRATFTEAYEVEQSSYDAELLGERRFAPGVAWAHACGSLGRAVGVLPLPLEGVWRGTLEVGVEGTFRSLHFVTTEGEHRAFFRDAILVEDADEIQFAELAPSAFPALAWADDVWAGLGHFSRPYADLRDELVRYLGALDEHGAQTFHEHRGGDPRDLARVASVRIGRETSDENGATKAHAPSRRCRTRRYRGMERVFWWHIKLQPHVDRIHFLHQPPSSPDDEPAEGRIIVGLFVDHCTLPGRP